MIVYHKIVECDEAISREAVLSKIKEVCFSEEWLQFRIDNGSNGQRDYLINYIKQLSPVNPNKYGKWKREEFTIETIKVAYFCDKCGRGSYSATRYCPSCGAKMESEVING